MDDCRKAIRRVARSTNRLNGVYYFLGKRSGVNENTLAFLCVLDDGEAHTQKEISDKYLIPRTTVNSIAKALLAKGYIRFCPQRIGKEKELLLTPQGREYAKKTLAEIYAAEDRAMEKTLSVFSPEFIAALEFYADCLNQELEALPRE